MTTMLKTKMSTVSTLALILALATGAFAATDEEKCQKKKLVALGKRDLCLQKERAKELVGKTPDTAKCAEKLDKMLVAAEKTVACRWLENGDGTATDLNTGLQWELKTEDDTIHDKDAVYDWSASGTAPDGGAFADFLGTLNGGVSTEVGQTGTTGCFADECDWRVPTIEELQGIVDLSVPGCGEGTPCTTIPGEAVLSPYWSSVSFVVPESTGAYGTNYQNGENSVNPKSVAFPVRAVRGGS